MAKDERRAPLATTITREESGGGISVLRLAGALRWPVGPELRLGVEARLAGGERAILLDLSQVSAIDAAGVGELVRLRAMANAVDADLWIENAGAQPRALLDAVGLLELLSLDSLFDYEQYS